MSEPSLSPTRPYLLRALYEWCADNSLTPYIAAFVDASVRVPQEFVKNNEIVLNISMDATSNLQIGNDYLQFKARFGGIAREIVVPISHVIAIYARENGQGMAFPSPANAVQPIGQVADMGATQVRPSALRSVPKPAEKEKVVALNQNAATEPTPTPIPTPKPAPKSNGKSTPKPSLVVASSEDPAEPPPPPNGSGSGAGAKRPSLTRIK
jgi:stringent starvation protein B